MYWDWHRCTFSGQRPLHLLLTRFNRKTFDSHSNSTDIEDKRMNKTGSSTSDIVHIFLLSNCLMMITWGRSTLYHDRRTQGHASPKVLLYSCWHCGHVISFATALLKFGCNVGWKPREKSPSSSLAHRSEFKIRLPRRSDCLCDPSLDVSFTSFLFTSQIVSFDRFLLARMGIRCVWRYPFPSSR